MRKAMTKYSIITAMTNNAIIHSGLTTHHQLQEITPQSCNTRNTMNIIIGSPASSIFISVKVFNC